MSEYERRSFDYDIDRIHENPNRYLDATTEYLFSSDFTAFLRSFGDQEHELSVPQVSLSNTDLPNKLRQMWNYQDENDLTDIVMSLRQTANTASSDDYLFNVSFLADGLRQNFTIDDKKVTFNTTSRGGDVLRYRLFPEDQIPATAIVIQLVEALARSFSNRGLADIVDPSAAKDLSEAAKLTAFMEYMGACQGVYQLDIQVAPVELENRIAIFGYTQKETAIDSSVAFFARTFEPNRVNPDLLEVDELYHNETSRYPNSPVTYIRHYQQSGDANALPITWLQAENKAKFINFRQQPIAWQRTTKKMFETIKKAVDISYKKLSPEQP